MSRHSIDAALLAADQPRHDGPHARRIGLDNPYEGPKAMLPRCQSPAVFVTMRWPYRQLTPEAVRAIMGRACDRAGLERRGAHRLRHALATSIYAKVDRNALRPLARPWPWPWPMP